MNDSGIIIATIGLVGTIAGAFATVKATARKRDVEEAAREQAQKDQLDNLNKALDSIKKRLDEHNHYAEKFAENSKNVAVMNERLLGVLKQTEQLQKDINLLKSNKCKL